MQQCSGPLVMISKTNQRLFYQKLHIDSKWEHLSPIQNPSFNNRICKNDSNDVNLKLHTL